MRNIYLIDFENVASEGLNGVLSLSEEDMVVLFYSVKSDKIAIRTHIQIGKSSAVFEYAEVTVGGKNALDHQLATYLGYLVAKNEAQRYYIVSRDNGYQYIARFWAKKAENACVECVPSIRAALQSMETQPPKEETAPAVLPVETPPAPTVVEEPQETARQAAARTPSVPQEVRPQVSLVSELEKLPLYAVISPSAKPEKTEEPKVEEPQPPAPQSAEPQAQETPVEQSHAGKGEGQQPAKPRPERSRKNGAKSQAKQGKKAENKQPQNGSPAGKQGNPKQGAPKHPAKAAGEKGSLTQEEKQRVDNYLKDYPQLPMDSIHTLILSGSKQKLCNSLRKNLGQEKGLELYNNIKAIIWK